MVAAAHNYSQSQKRSEAEEILCPYCEHPSIQSVFKPVSKLETDENGKTFECKKKFLLKKDVKMFSWINES